LPLVYALFVIEVIVYRRHNAECSHKTSKDQKRSCDCKVWVSWNKNGTQVQKSAKTRSWNLAAEYARQLETQFNNAELGKAPAPGAAKTVRDAVELFLTSKRNENLTADTLYRHTRITQSLVEFCDHQGILLIKDVTLAHLTMWQAQWTVKSPQARHTQQEKVRNFFKYCLANGMIATNPAISDHWKSVKVKFSDQNIRALSPQEYKKILSSIALTKMTDANKARIRALVQLQRWSGLSLVDAVCLSREELRREGKTFRVVTDRQKTGMFINNVIPAWLGEELLKVKNGNPKFFFWTENTPAQNAPSYFKKLYRRVFKEAGIKGSSHDFRHTYAIELLKAGVDIRTVSKALGHSSVTVTERFYSRWCSGQQNNLDETLSKALGQ